MKKIIRLTESDLTRIVQRVIQEQTESNTNDVSCLVKAGCKKGTTGGGATTAEVYEKTVGPLTYQFSTRINQVRVFGRGTNQVGTWECDPTSTGPIKGVKISNLKDKVIVTKAFGSGWTVGTSGAPHIDAIEKEPFIEYSTVIYLNDEYEGGEIYFPKQGFSTKAKKYSAIFFPGNDRAYLHGVKEITSGNRYTALYMQSTKKEFEDPDFEVYK